MPLWVFIGALFISGFILMLIEILIIPGFGGAGILGVLAIAMACYQAFTGLSPLVGAIVTIASIMLTIVMLKILPHTSAWGKIRLARSEEKSNGYQVGRPELQLLVNRTGTSLTMLRPSGTALIGDQRYDVITDGEFIKQNEPIIVYKVEGNKILVRASAGTTGQ